MTEMNEILPPDVRRNMKHAIEDLGLEEMINEIGIDKSVKILIFASVRARSRTEISSEWRISTMFKFSPRTEPRTTA